MSVFHTIMLVVGLLALIGFIVCVLGLAGVLPYGRAASKDGWDSPYLCAMLVSSVVFALAVVLDGLVFVWEHDPTHIAAPGLATLFLLLIEMWARRVLDASLLGWWRKLVPAPVAAPPKKPWLSKTILVNALVTGLLIAENKLGFLQGVLPASKYQIVAFTLPIVNMLLRVYTTQGVSLKPQQQAGASE
jgi:hypothetical protein